jgi:NitT/TauT family transport system ATP-binding protein
VPSVPSDDYIRLTGLSKAFAHRGGELLALAPTDLAIAEGEFISVIGPSGCGKTTLLRLIGGLLEPTAGRAAIGGRDPTDAQREKQIGYVFQDPSLLPWRTVTGNIRLPLQVNRSGAAPESDWAGEMAELVGLGEFARYYPHQLSGGMKQRVALARALVFDPALLLMDEPLGSLDEITRSQMRYELLRIWEARRSGGTRSAPRAAPERKTVVMVTHSVAEAALLSDRVVVMAGLPGRIVGIVPVGLPRPRAPGIERTGAFLDLVERIQALLAQGGAVGAAALAGRR